MTMQKETIGKFYQSIRNTVHEKRGIYGAIFELTYKCNFKCVHCCLVPDKRKKELTTNQVKNILDQLKQMGCLQVEFTGGEPFLRKDIFTILDYAKKQGFLITILTNGSLIDKKTAKKIASLGVSLNKVDISVYGASRKTFEKITGRKDAFKRVIRAIKYLRESGVNVQIKFILLELNKKECSKIGELAKKLGTMSRFGFIVTPKVNGNPRPLLYQVNPEEINKIYKALRIYKIKAGEECWNFKTAGKKKIFRCEAGKLTASISPYGEISPCMLFRFSKYKISSGPLKEGWSKIRKYIAGLKPPRKWKCRHCKLYSFCMSCPGLSYLLNKDLTSCPSAIKRITSAVYKDR